MKTRKQSANADSALEILNEVEKMERQDGVSSEFPIILREDL